MRIQTNVDPQKTYVAGRAGEIADYANPLTYSLLEKIFGFNGPYRQVLSEYGVGDEYVNDNYLLNIHGRIYSDMEKENTILWEPSGMKLVIKNGLPRVVTHIFTKQFPKNIKRLMQKTKNEIDIMARPAKYTKVADEHYKKLSEIAEKTYTEKSIELHDFLKAYQHVVHIAYIYELLYQLHPTINVKLPMAAKQYVWKQDYLNHVVDGMIEHAFFQRGYSLGSLADIRPSATSFVPDQIADPPETTKNLGPVLKLQVLRNNARLKVQLLLYYLNAKLLNKALKYHMTEFGFLTIDEVNILDKTTVEHLSTVIQDRRNYYEQGKEFVLPLIIQNGLVSKGDAKETEPSKWFGTPCSGGYVEGALSVVNNVDEEITTEIIMLPNASPLYTIYYKKAKGLIFQTGSPLSHGAIVAREMGVPALVLDADLTKFNRRRFHLDGNTGTLSLLS
ncbi:hypothetical protein KC614_00050 [candidate division WWE3 bacterium]|uniref:PEP-utilising enzyme mobile domain-containing protein n=1 Tax=candidate division WWE3 bacterium TaxID=2053526 RepID=A0A955LJE1_UNCKA|nr:hypothetical protein [candidate division WWE3 bacterium]